MNAKKFYVTCAIPYVNAAPHIGHALEFIQGDVIARYHALLGEETLLLSGGDENALKNVQAAEKAGLPLQEFIDINTDKFHTLTKALGCRFDVWQKGSDTDHHFKASQKLWGLCKKDDIYSKSYEGLYCIGCETFYAQDELNDNGECFEHPGKKLESVKETNYFFRLSAYQKDILRILETGQLKIVPEKRKNEVIAFVKRGLDDISISRSNARAKNWGVPVPGDDTQRMYVWFDALNIYQSGVGFGWDEEKYSTWWPADVHVIGKGITRFHAVYWPAFLLSAGLQLPKAIFVHEYFTVNGQKMSKTLGNVIDPISLIDTYGAEPLRYYFLAKFSPFNDGDFSEDEFKKVYNADLANGLGNLVARVAKLCESLPQNYAGHELHTAFDTDTRGGESVSVSEYEKKFVDAMNRFAFNDALSSLWEEIKKLDAEISDVKPWEYAKKTERTKDIQAFLVSTVARIKQITTYLQPFMPITAQKIHEQFSGPTIASQTPLFPRIS